MTTGDPTGPVLRLRRSGQRQSSTARRAEAQRFTHAGEHGISRPAHLGPPRRSERASVTIIGTSGELLRPLHALLCLLHVLLAFPSQSLPLLRIATFEGLSSAFAMLRSHLVMLGRFAVLLRCLLPHLLLSNCHRRLLICENYISFAEMIGAHNVANAIPRTVINQLPYR